MRISDWSSDVCSSDLVVGSARYENDDFSPYDYQAIASAGYGHKFIENERTRLSTEVGPGFRRARDAETGEVEHGVVGRGDRKSAVSGQSVSTCISRWSPDHSKKKTNKDLQTE